MSHLLIDGPTLMNDMLDIAQKILSSDVFNFLLIGGLAYIALLWIAIILWVTKDITNRSDNILFQIICISLVIFLTPIFGLIIYLILRPSKTLTEQYYEEMQENFWSHEENSAHIEHCPHCMARCGKEFKFCPACGEQVGEACTSCNENTHVQWTSCPYCGVKKATEEIVVEAPKKLEKKKKKIEKKEKKLEA